MRRGEVGEAAGGWSCLRQIPDLYKDWTRDATAGFYPTYIKTVIFARLRPQSTKKHLKGEKKTR